MPNATGSRGVPKYVRQIEGTVENSNGSYFNGWWTDADSAGAADGQPSESSSPSPDENRNESNRIRVDAGTLSASAVEFKPKVPETTPPINNGKVSYAAAAAKIASTA